MSLELFLFARREPTTDSAILNAAKVYPGIEKRHLDVCLYSDAACTKQVARTPWHYSNCPTKRNKYVTHNCARYRLVWVPSTAEMLQAVKDFQKPHTMTPQEAQALSTSPKNPPKVPAKLCPARESNFARKHRQDIINGTGRGPDGVGR